MNRRILKEKYYLCTIETKQDITMKQIVYCMALAGMMVLTVSCGNKKQSDDIIAERIEKPKLQAPIRQSDYDKQTEVQWGGNTYRVAIHRQPNDSLPMVKDEMGQKFVDNEVTVSVTRADGTIFFERTFTKSSFNSSLDDDYRKTGILDGLVFDKANGSNLEFAGSVSHPQTDEYIPIRLVLDRMGSVTTKRDVEAVGDEEEMAD